MRIIFLDIDGVILSGRALWASRDHTYLPPRAIALLNEAVRRTGADVVVSSTWRRDENCRDRLRAAGFEHEFHEDWRTLPLGGGFRGHQIAKWLDEHPAVERYVILDDDSDMRPEQKPFFVQTKFEDGIQPEHVEKIVAILGECHERACLHARL